MNVEAVIRSDEGETERVKALFDRLFPHGKIRRVLLVTPPDVTAELFSCEMARMRRYSNYPAYGLGLLAQHLRKIGIEPMLLNLNHRVLEAAFATNDVSEFDFEATWQSALDDAIAEFEPDLVGVTCMFTMTHASLRTVCRHLSNRDVALAIGGVHVSNDVDRILEDIPYANFAFLREGENALKRFVEVVEGNASIEELSQVVINLPGRRIRFDMDLRPTAVELDVIPAYEIMDTARNSTFGIIGNYHGFRSRETKFATVLSNRGCRARCTFCSVRNFNGPTVRQRSVGSVLDELQELKEVYGIGHIVWLDDDLLKDEARAISLFDGMVQRNLGLTWDATNGLIAASCKEEVVSAMADSGCIAVSLGIESGNPEILRRVHKPGTVQNFLAAAEAFKKKPQIHTRAFLIIGFPNETMSMINDTLRLAEEMKLDWYSTTVLQPLPNTPIYDAMVSDGLIETEVGSSSVRFNSGSYGKQIEFDLGMRSIDDFEQAILGIPENVIPNPGQLTNIWFYMNYHLNFRRLFTEERPVKLKQQLLNLTALANVISPEHALALYFLAYVKYKISGTMDATVVTRLRNQLSDSPYWDSRLKAFGLSVSDLESRSFAGKEVQRLLLAGG